MRRLDLYWKSNRDWWEYKDHVPTLKDSAPPEAVLSYQRYLEQVSNAEEV